MEKFKKYLSASLKRGAWELVLQENVSPEVVNHQGQQGTLMRKSGVVERNWILGVLSQLYDEPTYERVKNHQPAKGLLQIRDGASVPIISRTQDQGLEVRFFVGGEKNQRAKERWQLWQQESQQKRQEASSQSAHYDKSSLPPLPPQGSESSQQALSAQMSSSEVVAQKNMSSWVASGVSSFSEMEDSSAYDHSAAGSEASSHVQSSMDDDEKAVPFSALPSEALHSSTIRHSSYQDSDDQDESSSYSSSEMLSRSEKAVASNQAKSQDDLASQSTSETVDTTSGLTHLNLSALEEITKDHDMNSSEFASQSGSYNLHTDFESRDTGFTPSNSLKSFLEENVNFDTTVKSSRPFALGEGAGDDGQVSAKTQKTPPPPPPPTSQVFPSVAAEPAAASSILSAPASSSASSPVGSSQGAQEKIVSEEVTQQMEEDSLVMNSSSDTDEGVKDVDLEKDEKVDGEYFSSASDQESAFSYEDTSFLMHKEVLDSKRGVFWDYLKKLSLEQATWGYLVPGKKLLWRNSQGEVKEATDMAAWESVDVLSDLAGVMSAVDQPSWFSRDEAFSFMLPLEEGPSFWVQGVPCSQGVALSFKNLGALSYGGLGLWDLSAEDLKVFGELKEELSATSRKGGLYVVGSVNAALRGDLMAHLVAHLFEKGSPVVKFVEGPGEWFAGDPRWGQHVKVGNSYKHWRKALEAALSPGAMPCDVLCVSGLSQDVMGSVVHEWVLPAVDRGVKVIMSCSEISPYTLANSLLYESSQEDPWAGKLLARSWKWLVYGVKVHDGATVLEQGRVQKDWAEWLAQGPSKNWKSVEQKEKFCRAWHSSGGSLLQVSLQGLISKGVVKAEDLSSLAYDTELLEVQKKSALGTVQQFPQDIAQKKSQDEGPGVTPHSWAS